MNSWYETRCSSMQPSWTTVPSLYRALLQGPSCLGREHHWGLSKLTCKRAYGGNAPEVEACTANPPHPITRLTRTTEACFRLLPGLCLPACIQNGSFPKPPFQTQSLSAFSYFRHLKQLNIYRRKVNAGGLSTFPQFLFSEVSYIHSRL